jgi:hypothetical protein
MNPYYASNKFSIARYLIRVLRSLGLIIKRNNGNRGEGANEVFEWL